MLKELNSPESFHDFVIISVRKGLGLGFIQEPEVVF